MFPDDGRDAETLIRNADAAMYHAKELGRANYQFFTAEMNQAASRRLALESRPAPRARQATSCACYYQPIVDAKTGRIAGHEALLRWQHPERGLVAPGDFIQLAEETGMILKLGEWVLREACRWATCIGVERGLPVCGEPVAAPVQRSEARAHGRGRAARNRAAARACSSSRSPRRTAMQHTDVTLATLNRLKALGVSIAIDDFGTGYSSLAYLKRFPVDKLKIDRSFVADMPDDARAVRDRRRAIVALAHALELQVIAEGVESEEQRAFLAELRLRIHPGLPHRRAARRGRAAKDFV